MFVGQPVCVCIYCVVPVFRLEYFDDRAKAEKKESSVDFDPESRQPFAWLTKNIHAFGIKIDLDDDASAFVPATLPDSTGTSPTEVHTGELRLQGYSCRS